MVVKINRYNLVVGTNKIRLPANVLLISCMPDGNNLSVSYYYANGVKMRLPLASSMYNPPVPYHTGDSDYIECTATAVGVLAVMYEVENE